jgi:hypothetical protein
MGTAVEANCRKVTSAAVLIRLSSQWSTARCTVRALLESGATVMIFFLGFAPMTADYPLPEHPCLECYADSRQKNMAYLSVDAIAAILKRCDLVIPV